MSHRGELTARLLDIQFLLNERPQTLREMAAHLGVSPRTIQRAIDTLSSRFPIIEDREGREIRYSFARDYEFRPPPFTSAELATLLLAQESIAATGLTAISSPFARHAESLLRKVRAALHPSLHEKLDAMAAVFGSASVPAKDFARFAETIERLTDAAVERKRIKIRYYTLHANTFSERLVDPYAVYFDPDGATLKLIGHDHKRKGVIPFAIDHILSIRETRERFTRPADWDLREFLAENCFNGIHGDPVVVRLKARGVTARVFAERTFHRSQRIVEKTLRTDEAEETTTIEMRVAGGRGLVRFILSWGPDVEVLSPAELRREVAETHRRALAMYENEG